MSWRGWLADVREPMLARAAKNSLSNLALGEVPLRRALATIRAASGDREVR
jgi:hypothetical protein